VGDRIVAINGRPVDDWEDVPTYVQAHGESQLVFTMERDGRLLDIPVTPRAETVGGERVPRIGIGPQTFIEREPVHVAIGRTVGDMPRITWATLKALGGIFSPSGMENYSDLLRGKDADENGRFLSPVGVARVAGNAVENGWSEVLFLLMAINIFVGVFNMVPLLPLDGGHVAIATYEKIASMVTKRRVQVDVARLMPITAAVLFVLVAMGISALYLDIVSPVRGP
jgi:membrane-associated protease RseP (regulator of RpoE activity)